MKNIQIFIVCILLVLAGMLFEDLVSLPILNLLNFISSIFGIIGGACALLAFLQWKKQVEHGKKFDVLEALEKVHTAADSLNVALLSMLEEIDKYHGSDNEDVKNHWKKEYELSFLRYTKARERINLFNAELLVKSRLFKAFNQDYELHKLMTNVLSVTTKITREKIPECLPTNSAEANALRNIILSFNSDKDTVCGAYRNYLYNSLEISRK